MEASLRLALCLLGAAAAQQVGVATEEALGREEGAPTEGCSSALPAIPVQNCTLAAGCTTQQAAMTLDANWRWVHDVSGHLNCFTGSSWDPTLCPDPETCTRKCAVEGVDVVGYEKTYGVKTVCDGVDLGFISEGGNVGSRLYVTEADASNRTTYKLFRLKNREFSFDVDVSKLPCGLNGALYFVEMQADGGKGNSSAAGAKFGTGYCDAQCPHDVKWIDGQANSMGWSSQNALGHYGSCCAEMDVWEANRMASAFTPHPCDLEGAFCCEGSDCGDYGKGERYLGVCDKDGCDWNSYRMGAREFYGPSLVVDTTKPFSVVTQFLTSNGTDEGELSEIRRLYVRDGRVIQNSNATLRGFNDVKGNSITDEFCKAQKEAFYAPNDFAAKGGLKQMGEALDRGMVLVLSIWDDSATDMAWLDSTWPVGHPTNDPGVLRGPCVPGSGKSAYVRSAFPDAKVEFTNIRAGEIGSTFVGSRRLTDVHV